MKVFVLGSNSFMGSSIVDSLIENDIEVIGVGRTKKDNILKPTSKFTEFHCDINKNSDVIIKLLNKYKPNIVINCIALGIVDTSWDIPFDYFNTNCVSLTKIVHSLIDSDYLDKFLQASTPEVYGNIPNSFVESKIYNPSTPYAASKAAFDVYLDLVNKQYNFPSIMFRFANIYGPHQQLFRIIPKTLITIRQHGKLSLDGGGITRRSFVYSSDLCNGVNKLIMYGKPGIYHFAGNEYITMKDLVHKICSLVGYDFKQLVEFSPDRRGKDVEYNLNCDKAINELVWNPTVNIDDGILNTSEWVDSNWPEINKLWK
jgi:dTDP-glucose 4,6-dehydratase